MIVLWLFASVRATRVIKQRQLTARTTTVDVKNIAKVRQKAVENVNVSSVKKTHFQVCAVQVIVSSSFVVHEWSLHNCATAKP